MKILTVVLLLMASTVFDPAHAKKLVIDLESSDLHEYEDTTLSVSHYLLEIELPVAVSGKEIYGATLEFYVDAANRDSTARRNDPAPSIDVRSYSGSATSFEVDNVVGTRGLVTSVPLGLDRRVKVDVTDIIAASASAEESSVVIAIGTFSNNPEGSFGILSDRIQPGKVARLKIHYNKRS